MVEDCLDHGLPEPEFKDTGTSMVVVFRKSKLTEEYLEGLELNERQKEAIKYLKKHRKITSKKYAELFEITRRTARNDLKNLVEKDVVSPKGESKKERYYVLSEI